MKATEWFAIASAEGVFCGERYSKPTVAPSPVAHVAMDFKPVPVDRFVDGKWVCIWSDTGLPYNPKVHGGR